MVKHSRKNKNQSNSHNPETPILEGVNWTTRVFPEEVAQREYPQGGPEYEARLQKVIAENIAHMNRKKNEQGLVTGLISMPSSVAERLLEVGSLQFKHENPNIRGFQAWDFDAAKAASDQAISYTAKQQRDGNIEQTRILEVLMSEAIPSDEGNLWWFTPPAGFEPIASYQPGEELQRHVESLTRAIGYSAIGENPPGQSDNVA
jgi:hypothetical protein